MQEIETLVLSGGGVKGIIFIGSLKALNDKNLLNNIKECIGTSAGSLIALLLALKYKITEIEKLTYKVDFTNFINITSENIFNFPNEFGIDDGNNYQKFIEILIKAKIGKKEITFKELFNYSNIKLTVIATNLSTQSLVIFNYLNTPDMIVSIAVRMSCSVPLYFKPVLYNNDLYIDGSVLNNYPINLSSDKKKNFRIINKIWQK